MQRPPTYPQLRIGHFVRPRGCVRWDSLAGADSVRCTYSGRAAIYQYLAGLRARCARESSERTVILLPAFHCPTVVDPCLHAGFDVRFYAITPELRVDSADFLGKLDQRVAAALFIRYFGLTQLDRDLVAACRTAGARVIHDCSHSFLTANPPQLADEGADVAIYSFWKLLPTVVGGGFLPAADDRRQERARLSRPPLADTWRRTKGFGAQMMLEPLGERFRKQQHGNGAAESASQPAVPTTAAEAYPYVPEASSWEMPSTALTILRHADLSEVVETRRRNYALLGERIEEQTGLHILRRTLDDADCPWGFPVLLEGRARKDYIMRGRGVPLFTFGEVLHPLLASAHVGERILETAAYLSASMLAFVIHQQVSAATVTDYAATINATLAELTVPT